MGTRIAVLGAGSWGTALASHLAGNGHNVTLWGRTSAAIDSMRADCENTRYLPGIKLAQTLRYTSNLDEALADATDVLISVPSHSFRNLLEHIVTQRAADCGVIWACKGLEAGSGRFLSQVAEEVLGSEGRYAVVSGPTFAAELAATLPTAITVAANRSGYGQQVSEWLHNERFRAYTTDDINGVQLGGALKNIYAIAAGISDGLQFGANARVALITRGLAELKRLGEPLGARTETLMGLSGMGDLILTCTDDQSRNRRFGLALAQGDSVDDAKAGIGQSVEGVNAIRAARDLGLRYGVELPIVEQVYEVICNQRPAGVAVEALLRRARKSELQ